MVTGRKGRDQGAIPLNGVMTRKQVVKSLAFPDLKLSVAGNAAIVRHIYLAESELDGKATTTPDRRPPNVAKARRHFGSCWRGRGSGCRHS